MGLGKSIKTFGHNLSGKEVHKLDDQLKELNQYYNDASHDAWLRASRRPLGWGFVPGHRQYRLNYAQRDPEVQDLAGIIQETQEHRKSAARSRNRARGHLALGLAGTAAVTAGGIALKKYYDKRKAEKEEEEEQQDSSYPYYKTASIKDTVGTISRTAKNVPKIVKKNFRHAEEFDHMYSKSKKQRLRDILSGKRIKNQSAVLKSIRKTHSIPNSQGNAKLSELRTRLNNMNEAQKDYEVLQRSLNDMNKEKASRLSSEFNNIVNNNFTARRGNESDVDYAARLAGKYQYSKSFNKKYVQDYGNKQKKIERALKVQRELVNDADSYAQSRIKKMNATRNNEIAKTIGMYAVPTAAATIGGVAIYKHHQNKKNRSENSNEHES